MSEGSRVYNRGIKQFLKHNSKLNFIIANDIEIIEIYKIEFICQLLN